MQYLGLGSFFRGIVVLLVCLCQACTAFVPATTRLPRCRVQRQSSSSAVVTQLSQQQHSTAPTAPTVAAAAEAASAAQAAVASLRRRATASGRRRAPVASCSNGGVGDEGVEVAVAENDAGDDDGAAAAATEDDPFRPERASVSPLVINALLPMLFTEVRAGYDCDVLVGCAM